MNRSPEELDPSSLHKAGLESQDIEAVFDVSALPYSYAFEHALYDQRTSRAATYRQQKHEDFTSDVFTFDQTLLASQFPDEFLAFTGSTCSISKLCIDQFDTPHQQIVNISLSINDKDLAAQLTASTNDKHYRARVMSTNASGEHTSYDNFSPESIISLLASAAYAAQYDPNGGGVNFDEPLIYTERPLDSALIEQIITTLGQLQGQASIKTVANLDSTTKFVMTETQTPESDTNNNNIHFISTNSPESVEMNQLAVQAHLNTPLSILSEEDIEFLTLMSSLESDSLNDSQNKQYEDATIASDGQVRTITPETDLATWASLCKRLLEKVGPSMESHRHLDESSRLL